MNKIALATLASAALVSAADYIVSVPTADVATVGECTTTELYKLDATHTVYKIADDAAAFADTACSGQATDAEVEVVALPPACAVRGGAAVCAQVADAVCNTATANFCVEGYECKVADDAAEGVTEGTCVAKAEPTDHKYVVAIPTAKVATFTDCAVGAELYKLGDKSVYEITDGAAVFGETACAKQAKEEVVNLPAACVAKGADAQCPLDKDAACTAIQVCGADQVCNATWVEKDAKCVSELTGFKKTTIEVKSTEKDGKVDWTAVGKSFADYAASEEGKKHACAKFFTNVKFGAQDGGKNALVFTPVDKCDDVALKEFLTAAIKPAEGKTATVELVKIAKFEDATVAGSCFDDKNALTGCGAKCSVPCKEGVECAETKDCFDGAKCNEVKEDKKDDDKKTTADAKKVCSSASMYSVLAAASVAALALFF